MGGVAIMEQLKAVSFARLDHFHEAFIRVRQICPFGRFAWWLFKQIVHRLSGLDAEDVKDAKLGETE